MIADTSSVIVLGCRNSRATVRDLFDTSAENDVKVVVPSTLVRVTGIRDRLRRRLRADRDVETDDNAGQEDAVNPETPIDVRTTQSPERPPSTPPAASHVPDAALGFDPWGVRTSSSWDILR
jgi:hypothetical protein